MGEESLAGIMVAGILSSEIQENKSRPVEIGFSVDKHIGGL